MKKKLSLILAVVLSLCMSIPVFAASTYPTDGSDAGIPSQFVIEKKYVKNDGENSVDRFPDEILKFTATCTAAPMDPATAPALSVADLQVTNVTNNITVTVPAYTVPGKYNYEIKEQSPAEYAPGSKDTAGVVYDKGSVFIQVVVKYDGGSLKKFVTVAANGDFVGAETEDKKNDDATKKADFKNKYLLDGEVDPDLPGPQEPDPNPVPTPTPEDPDPVKPVPDSEKPEEKAKFKIMKQARGPLAGKEEFEVHVTLQSAKPVRSDIICNDGKEHVISKVGSANSGWTGTDATGYTAEVTLQIKDDEVAKFTGIPAGVKYKVQEDSKHIGQLTESNINDTTKGYTVAYYGGGTKVENPTASDAPDKDYGRDLFASGTVGANTNNNIVISNSKGANNEDSDMVKPNTGINLETLPYVVILGLVIIGAGMMFVKSRRRREE